MILPGAVKIEGKTIRVLQAPVVYIWMREDVCLYVGASMNGIFRALGPGHHIIGKKDKIESTDIIYLYHVGAGKMSKLETELIDILKPKYNRTGLGAHRWSNKENKHKDNHGTRSNPT